MRRKALRNRSIAILSAAVIMIASAGCASEKEDTSQVKSTDFTYMVSNGITAEFFEQYEEAPAVKYVLNKEWDPDDNGNSRKISLHVLTPPGGSESDYANTLISTGDYPDVMNIQMTSMTASEMYEDEMILDITDYVNQYMPNYMAYFDRHPELAGRQLNMVDGEPRYLCLYDLEEVMSNPWSGMMYRRDWIVRYGTDPKTEEPFSGEWDDDGNWVDNVVFPSGNTDPVYVSDWEWMLDIFQTALEEQGITDGYAYNVAASGENGAGGDMESGFGATATWYMNPFSDEHEVIYGGTLDGFRAYLEMMHTWYERGWVNPTFYEHAEEMFFMVDVEKVYSGKVGAWYGTLSALGNTLDVSKGDASDPTNGIVVLAAPTPINDIYGNDEVQNITPFLYYANGQFGAQTVITKKAEEKDLPALFTFLDYLYSEEGSLIKQFGLNHEQVSECRTSVPEAAALYDEWGMEDGAYTVQDSGLILRNPVVKEQDQIDRASIILRLTGLTDASREDQGWLPYYAHTRSLCRMYPNTAAIGSEITSQLTPEQSANYSEVFGNVRVYNSIHLPKFITGEMDIYDDAVWEKYCADIEAMDVQSYCDDINALMGAN